MISIRSLTKVTLMVMVFGCSIDAPVGLETVWLLAEMTGMTEISKSNSTWYEDLDEDGMVWVLQFRCIPQGCIRNLSYDCDDVDDTIHPYARNK